MKLLTPNAGARKFGEALATIEIEARNSKLLATHRPLTDEETAWLHVLTVAKKCGCDPCLEFDAPTTHQQRLLRELRDCGASVAVYAEDEATAQVYVNLDGAQAQLSVPARSRDLPVRLMQATIGQWIAAAGVAGVLFILILILNLIGG